MKFPNANQIYLYLTGQHKELKSEVLYKLSKNTVGNHIKSGILKPARGGGFPKKTVDTYARNHLTPQDDTAGNKPVPKQAPLDMGGAQERKVSADAELKSIEAKRKKILFEREIGKLIPILIFSRELAERYKSTKLMLTNFSYEVGPEVAEIFGGDEQARELVELVGGDPDKAGEITRHMVKQLPEFTQIFRERVREALDSLVTGEWYTEEMREAWEKWQKSRVAGSRRDARAAIRLVDGDLEKVGELLENFDLMERTDDLS